MNRADYLKLINLPDPYTRVLPIPPISGWNSYSPNFALAKDRKICVEVGSWSGFSARTICHYLNNDAILFCIDTFLGSEEHMIENLLPRDTAGRPVLYEMFINNTQEFKDKIIPVQITANSFSIVAKKKDIKFDFIYIDGDHSKEAVYQDLSNYYPLLQDGGILIGDDIAFESVQQGLGKFINDFKITNCEVSNGQFIIKK